MASSYYEIRSIAHFVAEPAPGILGTLAEGSEFDVTQEQRDAWREQIDILHEALTGLNGSVTLEYVVPRIGSRVDAVVILGAALVVIEFKVGAKKFDMSGIDQVWDYALDLKNFHEASHAAAIFPILVATDAKAADDEFGVPFRDYVYPPARCNAAGLRTLLLDAERQAKGAIIDSEAWASGRYRPTPTIIEAARALYREHSVESIARNDAGAKNLVATSACVERIADSAKANREKAIIFVTGVPGAGKTLVGLNLATKRLDADAQHSVFLSGNGPLVTVLREALALDYVEQKAATEQKVKKGDARRIVSTFIQNIHHFRDDALRSEEAPGDHLVIFDEAQRAWDRKQTSDFMRRKKGQPNFNESESGFLISYLDRHVDWAVIVCLVGGGQEIHKGEAGISAWLDAARERFPSWRIHLSSKLTESEYKAEEAIGRLDGRAGVSYDSDLHLSTSMRSFRAERLSDLVRAILDLEVETARGCAHALSEKYPIVLTRDLSAAKAWIKQNARGTERFGLVASSAAQRLKPHAIDVRVKIDPRHWFLKGRDDTRSSNYLEDAATEFQVQGLELDWSLVTWDADLRFQKGAWTYNEFKGSKWQTVGATNPIRERYLLNAYRVLLTRARQGMAIFIPPGDPDDHTRPPKFYNETFEYLAGLGLPTLP